MNEHNRRVVAGVNAYNREVSAYNQQVARHVGETNRQIDTRNRTADAHNREVISNLDSALRKAQHSPTVTYTPAESALCDKPGSKSSVSLVSKKYQVVDDGPVELLVFFFSRC